MTINILKSTKFQGICLLFAVTLLIASCNKDLPVAQPIIYPTANNTTTSIGTMLAQDTAHYSFFIAAATKSGLLGQLSDSSKFFTVFLPNNAAFIASGFPSLAAVNAQSATTLGGIVGYSIIPGKQFTSDLIPTTFPNIQLPTQVYTGSTLPGTTLQFNLTSFPSRRTNGFWDNTIPVLQPDIKMRNGVVHLVAGIVAPPSLVLAQIIYADPQFTLFDSLIKRGDLAQPKPDLKVDSIIKNAGANLTVFAPTNTAVKAFINAASGGAVPLAAPDAVFFDFIRNSLPTTTAQGIVLYHILGVRAFSVNCPQAATSFPTLLNGGIPTHPGLSLQSFFTGLSVDSIKVLGVANGGIPATSKPKVNFDKNGVNGVVHIIDRVLLPL